MGPVFQMLAARPLSDSLFVLRCSSAGPAGETGRAGCDADRSILARFDMLAALGVCCVCADKDEGVFLFEGKVVSSSAICGVFGRDLL